MVELRAARHNLQSDAEFCKIRIILGAGTPPGKMRLFRFWVRFRSKSHTKRKAPARALASALRRVSHPEAEEPKRLKLALFSELEAGKLPPELKPKELRASDARCHSSGYASYRGCAQTVGIEVR